MSVTWNEEEVLRRVRLGAMQGVAIGAQLVHERGTVLMTTPPKSGRMYGKHRASAPGEAPASDTGRLVGSGDVFLDPADLSARVNWSAAHAKSLEIGTEKMEPRPFARRSLAEKQPEIQEAVRSRVGAALT